MTTPQNQFVQVFVTFPNKEKAAEIARTLVEESLAGCVQIMGPIQSVYRWQGQIESAEEWLCLIKTSSQRYPALEARIREMHPYEVPEILAVPVSAGIAEYLDWLTAVLGGRG